MRDSKKAFWWFLGLFLLFSACVPTRQLPTGKHYLYQQEIEGVSSERAEELSAFLRQEPNRRFPLIPALPYVYFYNWGKRIYDKKYPTQFLIDSVVEAEKRAVRKKYQKKLQELDEDKLSHARKQQRIINKRNRKLEKIEEKREGNWLMQAVGEPPSLYDEQKAKESAEQMQQYLGQKGFFHAQVSTSKKQKGRRIYLNYQVEKKHAHRYRKITYYITDSLVAQLVVQDTLNRLFQPGDRYDEDILTAERNRLFDLMRNKGYFSLSKQFFFFEIDTTGQVPENKLDIRIVIESPPEGHKQYRLSKINFISDQQRDTSRIRRVKYEGIQFKEYSKNYSEKVLSHRIHLQKDSLYSHEDGVATQRSLAALDLFRFVNMRYDTLGQSLVSNIYVNSYPKYNVSLEAGVNVTQQRIPGPFATLSFQNRNLFQGCELLTIQLRGLLEAQGNFGELEQSSIYAQEYNLNINLDIPKFFFPFIRPLNKKMGKYNPRTSLQAGYTQTNRILYNRLNTQFSINYNWNNNRNASYDFRMLDINAVLTPSLAPSFRGYLDSLSAQGNPLIQSFRNSVLRSSSFSYTYNDNLFGDNPDSYFFRGTIEQGGTQIRKVIFNAPGVGNVLSRLINPDSLADYNYFRTDLDLRRVFRINRHAKFAARARLGLVYPFGRGATGDVLPYEKYFFIGGGNSIRAWQPRRLGPGGFSPPVREGSHVFDYPFEQPGELLIEVNAEWRRKLFPVAELALFVDAGNIWMLNDDSRPEAQFLWKNFWKQLAIGTGFGLRLDFSFFIVRGDVGIKLHDPAAQTGSGWLFRYFNLGSPLGRRGQAVFNLAIGYPF